MFSFATDKIYEFIFNSYRKIASSLHFLRLKGDTGYNINLEDNCNLPILVTQLAQFLQTTQTIIPLHTHTTPPHPHTHHAQTLQ